MPERRPEWLPPLVGLRETPDRVQMNLLVHSQRWSPPPPISEDLRNIELQITYSNLRQELIRLLAELPEAPWEDQTFPSLADLGRELLEARHRVQQAPVLERTVVAQHEFERLMQWPD